MNITEFQLLMVKQKWKLAIKDQGIMFLQKPKWVYATSEQ